MTDEELGQLLDEVRALRAQIEELRHGVDVTLRGGRCRGCGGTKVFHVPWIADRADATRSEAMALKVIPPKPFQSNETIVGRLEAYVCAACGLVEWYAKDPRKLTMDFQPIPGGEEPPYR